MKRELKLRMIVEKLDWENQDTVRMTLLDEEFSKNYMETTEKLRDVEILREKAMKYRVNPPTAPDGSPMPPELMQMLEAVERIGRPPQEGPKPFVWALSMKKKDYQAMGCPTLFDILTVVMKVAKAKP